MTAEKLLAELQAAGLSVVEEPGWKTRGNKWSVNGKPEGVMQHHTSIPNPFPIKRLYGPPLFRTKCNMATHEDGTLFLVAYKACNFSSGVGMLDRLVSNVRKSIPPTSNAPKVGLKFGNRSFWNFENSHPGDGSPIPVVQLQTIITANWVVDQHFELNWANTISHAEWTSRKSDPKWNGSNRTAINQIRTGVEALEDEMVTYRTVRNVPHDRHGDVKSWAKGVVDRSIDKWGTIVPDDPTMDDWENLDMTDGRFWTMSDRAYQRLHPDQDTTPDA